jgi:transposase
MNGRTRRKFTSEFKLETVRLIREGGKNLGQVCRDLGLSKSAVRNWVAQFEIDHGKGPTGAITTAERSELERLRRENRQLQMERVAITD